MTDLAARPRQVRLACTLAGFGAAFVLLNIFSVMAGWPPAALREELESLLAQPRFADAGVSVDTLLAWLRVTVMIVAVGCVTSIVLAVHTARRNRSARVALSVLLPITGLASLSVGVPGLLLLAVAVPSVVLLWQRDARAWFLAASERAATSNGLLPPPPRVSAYQPPKERPPTMSTQPPDQPPPQGQTFPGPSYPDSGQHEASHSGPSYPGPPAPPSYGQYPQQHGQPYGGYPGGPVVPQRRPGGVTAAAVITIVMSALTGLGWVIIALVWASNRAEMENRLLDDPQFRSLDIGREDLDTAASFLYGLAGVFTLASLAALVAAILTLRGVNWARIVTIILAALTVVIALILVLGQGWIALVWLIAGATVIGLLLSGSARAWFDARAHNADAARSPY